MNSWEITKTPQDYRDDAKRYMGSFLEHFRKANEHINNMTKIIKEYEKNN